MKEDRRGEDDAVQAIEHASMALHHAAPVLDAAIALAAWANKSTPKKFTPPAIEESPPAPMADQSSAIAPISDLTYDAGTAPPLDPNAKASSVAVSRT